MSEAAILREAATTIRDEWEPKRGSAWSTVQNFHLAVADLLLYEANKSEFLQKHGSRGHDADSWCVKVAAAYLGRDA